MINLKADDLRRNAHRIPVGFMDKASKRIVSNKIRY